MKKKVHKHFSKSPAAGFTIGFIVPVIIFIFIYIIKGEEISFTNYVKNLWHLHALIKLGSLCILANLFIFTIFIRLKHDQLARGVLGATIIYALFVLITRAF